MVKDTAIGAEGVGFVSGPANRTRCCQQLATAAMIFLRSCVAQALSPGDEHATRYALRCDTPIMKIYFFLIVWLDCIYFYGTEKVETGLRLPRISSLSKAVPTEKRL